VDIELSQLHHALVLLGQQPALVEAISAVVTRRVAALAGLTRGYSYKGHPAAVPVFENATAGVVAVTQRLAFHRPLRAKILIYLHRMVGCLGPRVLSLAHQVLPTLLAQADAGDADDVVQVLNQLMVEYQSECLPLVQDLLGVVADKYTALSAAIEQTSTAQVPASAAGDGAIQAPHLHTERLNLHRQYLLFIQHVAMHGCSPALYSSAHLPRLENILFGVVLPAISGGAVSTDPSREHSSNAVKVNPNHMGNTDTQDSVPVRKGALCILTALVNAWLLPPSAPVSPANAAVLANPPPAEVVAALRSYVLDQALPRALYSVSAWCTTNNNNNSRSINTASGVRAQLNVKDAAAQSVLVELAALLRATHASLSQEASGNGSNHSAAYFMKTLSGLGWPEHRTQQFLQHLAAPTPLGTFRDAFKLFIRECSN
jgi:hypothetical protein